MTKHGLPKSINTYISKQSKILIKNIKNPSVALSVQAEKSTHHPRSLSKTERNKRPRADARRAPS